MQRIVGYVVEDPSLGEEAFLSEKPITIMEKSTYNHLPIMMGYNSREGMLVHARDKKSFEENTPDIESTVPIFFDIPKGSTASKKVSKKIIEFYFGKNNPDEVDIDIAYKVILSLKWS